MVLAIPESPADLEAQPSLPDVLVKSPFVRYWGIPEFLVGQLSQQTMFQVIDHLVLREDSSDPDPERPSPVRENLEDLGPQEDPVVLLDLVDLGVPVVRGVRGFRVTLEVRLGHDVQMHPNFLVPLVFQALRLDPADPALLEALEILFDQ